MVQNPKLEEHDNGFGRPITGCHGSDFKQAIVS